MILKQKSKINIAAGAAVILFLLGVLFFVTRAPEQPKADMNGYYRDCVKTVLKNETVLPSCTGPRAIMTAYHVDVLQLLEDQRDKMIVTARRIARGDMTTDKEYKICIKQGECHAVPQLPRDRRKSDGGTPEYEQIRKDFWHLVDVGTLTPSLCRYMEECRAAVKAGYLKL